MDTTAVRGLRVAELAAAVGVSPDTVRYYERAGLLPPPDRTAAGYRSYDAGAVDRSGSSRERSGSVCTWRTSATC
jgi:predicted site-specific integrase-resolvase